MASIKRSSLIALIVLALLPVLAGLSQATITSFTLKAGEDLAHPISLIVEDRVLIQYKIVGGNISELQFSISFPNATVSDFDSIGDFSYSFINDVDGECMLNFNNTGQTEMHVTLDYEVRHYIFGIPQMLFMTIIVVLACVGGVFAFVLLGKPY